MRLSRVLVLFVAFHPVWNSTAQPLPCGGDVYSPISGVWSCQDGGILQGSASGAAPAKIELQAAPPSGHWAVEGRILPGQWEEAALIFAENVLGTQHAVLDLSSVEHFIGLGTIGGGSGEFEVFMEDMAAAGVPRHVTPAHEIWVRVEVDAASGTIRPIVRWKTFWDPEKELEVELRRHTFEFPNVWIPRAGWVLRSGEGSFRDLRLEAIPDDCGTHPDDCIFTRRDPGISYSLSPRLLKNIGLLFPGEQPQESHRFNVFTPSDAVLDATSRVNIAAFQYQRDKDYMGSVTIGTTDPAAQLLPAQYTFSAADLGTVELPLRWGSTGIHRAWVRDASDRLWYSNPVKVVAEQPEFLLVWGDYHCHTENSIDAYGTLEHFFDHSRNGAFLDFTGVSDHSESLTRLEFQEQIALEQSLNAPGRFVPVPGYEWTSSRYGHNNVYFIPSADEQGHWIAPTHYASLDTEFGNTTDRFEASLSELAGLVTQEDVQDVLLIPHHPGNGSFPTDWRYWYQDLHKVVEVCSWWGSSEAYGSPTSIFVLAEDYAGPGHYVRDALNLGIRIGMIGCSDTHNGQGGYDTGYLTYALGGYQDSVGNALGAESQYGGLTGLYVRELTLEGIFEALRARRSMASSCERRIRTDLRINAHWQGEDITLSPGTTLEIQVEVSGQDEMEFVELIRNGEVFSATVSSATDISWRLQDTVPVEGTVYYYVHAKQLDTAEGFSSPIWITAGEPIPTASPTQTPEPTATATPTTQPTAVPTAVHPEFDVNGDGVIDASDLLLFLEDWHRPTE